MSLGKKIVVATHNAHKLAEIRAILALSGWEFVSLNELGIADMPVEDADSFIGNARIKAQFAHEKTGLAALADDSGLVVDALDGAPGVYSSRYAGPDSNDAANNAKLLQQMQGVPDALRSARFVCALVFIDADGTETVAEGTVSGRIGKEPQGHNGFGYDPLFYPEASFFARSMAELSAHEKNLISHRSQALAKLRTLLADAEEQVEGPQAAESEEPTGDMQATGDGVSARGPQPVSTVSPCAAQQQIVVFDFDGTLIDTSSPVKLITRLNRDKIMSKRAVLKSLAWGIRYKMGRELDQTVPRRYVFASFKDFPASEADSIMRDVYRTELRQHLRPKAVAALKRHQAEGKVVIIVSASFEPIISELCLDLGVEHYLCTQMEVVDGSYTGETKSPPPESEHKLYQFVAWADASYGPDGWELTHAYGDHYSDVPLMEIAQHPIAVDPDHRLRSIAHERHWEVHDWLS